MEHRDRPGRGVATRAWRVAVLPSQYRKLAIHAVWWHLAPAWYDARRFGRSDPVGRVIVEILTDLEKIMSAIGPIGSETRRLIGPLSVHLQRHLFWFAGRGGRLAAQFDNRIGVPEQIWFKRPETVVVNTFEIQLGGGLAELGIEPTDAELILLIYRYLALHEAAHAFWHAVTLVVGDLAEMGPVESERFAEGVALVSSTDHLMRRYPQQLAGRTRGEVLSLLTAAMTVARPAGYNDPLPPSELTRKLEWAVGLEAAEMAGCSERGGAQGRSARRGAADDRTCASVPDTRAAGRRHPGPRPPPCRSRPAQAVRLRARGGSAAAGPPRRAVVVTGLLRDTSTSSP